MKKNLVRIVALLLVAMLALTLIPLGALAIEVGVGRDLYEKQNPTVDDYMNNTNYEHIDTVQGSTSVTIKTSNYDSYIIGSNGSGYDLKGIVDWAKYDKCDGDDKLPTASSVTFNKDSSILYAWLIYTPHQHKLSYWISDGTTHWRNCLVCDEQFIYQTWCQDGDEDEVCNICGGHVPYHDVKVIESEGGKITVNRDTASHRMKITADVEPAAGYKLEKLHFFKIREDGSRQEITRRKKDGQFYTTMPTYELEVSAEFVKN